MPNAQARIREALEKAVRGNPKVAEAMFLEVEERKVAEPVCDKFLQNDVDAVESLVFSSDSLAAKRIIFSGGPAGGTFQVVANAIQVYGPVKQSKTVKVRAQGSGWEESRCR